MFEIPKPFKSVTSHKMRDLKQLGLNWAEIQPNRIYNALVYSGDSLYYTNSGCPVFDANLVVLEKHDDVIYVGYLPQNRLQVGLSTEISRTQFENKILFTYAS